MDDGFVQFNVRLPQALKLEIMAYAKANRMMLQFAVEDLLRAGLGTPSPATKKKPAKKAVAKPKGAV